MTERDGKRSEKSTGSRWIPDFIQDVRRAARALMRSPGYTLVGVVTIALGVGATTAVFSLGNAMLLRPLPVPDATRLVSINEKRSGSINQGPEGTRVPFARYERYRDALRNIFPDLAGHQYNNVSISYKGDATSIPVAVVTRNYFDVLGLRPGVGSYFTAQRDQSIVISDRLWRSRFAASRATVGTLVLIDGKPFTITGITPPEFGGTTLPFVQDAWIPLDVYGGANSSHKVGLFGRLGPGVSFARAQSAVTTAATKNPTDDEKGTKVTDARLRVLTGLGENLRGDVVKFVSMLLVTALLVLLIAAANLAGMQLTRASGRRREIAVQVSIGATRSRIIRQLITESIVLFLLGGIGGILLAFVGTRLMSHIAVPISVPTLIDLQPDTRVLIFALVIAGVSGIVFGLAPALSSSRPDLVTALKDGSAGGTRTMRGRGVFVGAQITIAVLLLVVAGLFVRSLQKALVSDVGFSPDHVVVGILNLSPHGYDSEKADMFSQRLSSRLRAVPDVEGVGFSQLALQSGSNMFTDVENPEAKNIPAVNSGLNAIDTAFFRVMKMKILMGRNFNGSDVKTSPPVVIINETLAKKLWPTGSPLGHMLKRGGDQALIVGVVNDAKYNSATEENKPYAFYAMEQDYPGLIAVHVRTSGPTGEMIERMRHEVNAIDPSLALDAGRPMSAFVDATLFAQKFAAGVVGTFGIIGLILASLGVYGVLSAQVAQRTREFGIRVAIGATENDVLGGVMQLGARLAIVGGLVGLVLAALTTRVLGAFLFGIKPLDPVTFIAVPVFLAGVAMLASYIPARRATRIPPTQALRAD